MMEKTLNTMNKPESYDELMDSLSTTMAGLINGTIVPPVALNTVRMARAMLAVIQSQLNYVIVVGKKPEGNFSDLFKSKAETPHTTGGNGKGNGNGRRKTARSIIN